ncbi:MAG: deoxyribonuclease V [Myxococcales bacterium]|nr:deoxyribonuclease V [Myxococcales bacterium]
MLMPHPWNLSVPEATALQRALAAQVVEAPLPAPPRFVAGADISFDKYAPVLHAAFVVLDAESGEVVDRRGVQAPVGFPYVPGYLSFREVPPLLDAWAGLRVRPDLIICDGHGRAHPRRLGLACHLGLWLDRPTLGCGKSRLCGTFAEPGAERGDFSPLVDRDEVIGQVLRTRRGVKPVFVSVGHRITLDEARAQVLRLSKWRLPETTRQAHAEVNRLRRGARS